MNLSNYLQKTGVSLELMQVIDAMANAGINIAKAVTIADTGKTGTKNIYGDDQATLDVLSESIMQDELRKCSNVYSVLSEELSKPLKFNQEGTFTVCYDPLDGSSLIDSNLSIGTIFGVYSEHDLIGKTPASQVCAGFFLYGPKTTLMITIGSGTHEFTLVQDEFILTKENLHIAEEGKMFAPGNLRAAKERKDYAKLMNYWINEEYTLRYSGGMVADINQILAKGKGIFTYPAYSAMPEGKLRLLFECAPMALLVEQAGGTAIDGKERILDKKITDIAQKTPILIGSKKEIEMAQEFLKE